MSESTTAFFSNKASVTLVTDNGIRIVFRNHLHVTGDQYIIDYLEREIARNNPEVRTATDKEVSVLKDPLASIKAQAEKKAEAELRDKIKAELLAEMESSSTEAAPVKAKPVSSAVAAAVAKKS